MKSALYLIPVELGDTPQERVLPAYNREIILGIKKLGKTLLQNQRTPNIKEQYKED